MSFSTLSLQAAKSRPKEVTKILFFSYTPKNINKGAEIFDESSEIPVQKKTLDHLHQFWKTVNDYQNLGPNGFTDCTYLNASLDESQQIIEEVDDTLSRALSETIIKANEALNQSEVEIQVSHQSESRSKCAFRESTAIETYSNQIIVDIQAANIVETIEASSDSSQDSSILPATRKMNYQQANVHVPEDCTYLDESQQIGNTLSDTIIKKYEAPNESEVEIQMSHQSESSSKCVYEEITTIETNHTESIPQNLLVESTVTKIPVSIPKLMLPIDNQM